MTTAPSAIATRVGRRLVGDVDHVGRAARVEMAEAASCRGRARFSGRAERGSPPRRRPAASGSRRRGRCGCRRCSSRATSAWREDAALADDDAVAPGRAAPASRVTASETSKVRRSRLLMPMQAARRAAARARARPRRGPRRARPCRGRARVSIERARLCVVDARHDDEDAVGAPGARLEDLVGLEQEVLAQAGRPEASRACVRIFGPALERGRVGQHREAGGAALGIGAGEARRIEIGADQALRRARLLDLGDQRRLPCGDAAARWRAAKPRGGRAARARRSISAGGTRGLGGRDLLALVGFDARRGCRSWSGSRVRDGDERVERRLGGAAVDRARGARDARRAGRRPCRRRPGRRRR